MGSLTALASPRPSNLEPRTPQEDTMADDTQSGLRDRIARQGEDALGKLAQELLENPLVNSAIARAFDGAREGRPGAGDRDGRAQHPVGGRRRAPHAPPAFGVAADGGHRGGGRPARPAAGRDGPSRALDDRLASVEGQLGKLTIEISHLARRSTPRPPPPPREQERLKVDEPVAAPKPKRASRRRRKTLAERAARRARARPRRLSLGVVRRRPPTASTQAARDAVPRCDGEQGGGREVERDARRATVRP